MSDYLKNGNDFCWGPQVVKLNPDKALLLKKYARGHCLDIGFASGIYTNYLHSLGHTVVGVDSELEFVRQAKKTYPGIDFIHGSIYNLPFKPNTFGTIILFDVLEHLADQQVLKKIAKLGTRLIITVPHQNQTLLKKYSLFHSHCLDRTHLRSYTVSSLARVLRQTGWHPLKIKPILPTSLSGLLITSLSRHQPILKLILKIILKPFLPEPPICSAVFALCRSKPFIHHSPSKLIRK